MIQIQASFRLAAAARNQALDDLCEEILEHTDDEVCESNGFDIEFYGTKAQLLKVLKARGFKVDGDQVTRGKLKLDVVVPTGGKSFGGKAVYLRKAGK